MTGTQPGQWRPRLSVRGLMVGVAVFALGFAWYDSRKHAVRRSYYLDRARVYATRSREFSEKAVEARRQAAAFLRQADELEGEQADKHRGWAEDQLLRASLYRRVADFDARQERRFLAAAEQPWDPPPTETMDRPEPVFDTKSR